MSTYQTLYRKYRSQTFADLVGQAAISRALQGAIATDRVAHAYLFSGSRGTGKTSSARLLAKAVNCLAREPGASEPCNACESCRQIAAGAALDLIEIDAASNRGIDEIRDLREKVNLAPALGRRKVYIIDEAHMLTSEAFNALLKTLEEPPEHVVFVLCTTEAQKVPLTVLGRCQQFVFRRFTDEQVIQRLGWIAEREGIGVEPGVLELVARVAQGSMRDAVGLLDQLVPLADGRVSLESARSLLGIADPEEVAALVVAVLAGRAGEALDRLASVYEAGGELRQVVRGIMERCRDLLLEAIERRDEALRARLSGMLDGLLHLDGEVRRHAEPRFLVEATLVRLASEGVAVASPVGGEVARSAGGASIAAPTPAETAPSPGRGDTSPPSGEEPVNVSNEDVERRWQSIVNQLNPLVKAAFRAARPEVIDGVLVLRFDSRIVHEKAQQYPHAIQPHVDAWLGEGTRIEYRLAEDGGVTAPAAVAPEQHPIVLEALRKLEGQIVETKRQRP